VVLQALRSAAFAVEKRVDNDYSTEEMSVGDFALPKTPVLTFRALPEMQDALRRIAQRDNRSVSSLVELAVLQLLERDRKVHPPRKRGQAEKPPKKRPAARLDIAAPRLFSNV
jgi:hypothetical protein